MSFAFKFEQLESVFPMSLICNYEGQILQASQHFQNIFAQQKTQKFDQLFNISDETYFGFNTQFFLTHRTKNIFAVCEVNQQEYCFTFIDDPTNKILYLAARNLYSELKAKTELAAQLKSLASFPEENSNPVIRSDFQKNITYFNKSAKAHFLNPMDLLKLNPSLENAVQKSIDLMQDVEIEFNFGDQVFVSTCHPLRDEDFVNIYFRDISKEKENLKLAEEERNQKMLAAKLSSIGEIAAQVTHEINNPLAVIQGQASFSLKTLTAKMEPKSSGISSTVASTNSTASPQTGPAMNPELYEKIAKSFSIIIKASEKIDKIVRSLKNYSRNGQNDPLQRTSFQSILDDLLIFSSGVLKNYQVELKTDIPENLNLYCRPSEIHQVLLNLITNACDAIQDQSDKWISIRAFSEGTFQVIEVTDSGPGIPPDIQEKLLRPFFTTKAIGKGTGLGLSISRKIIENHQGKFFYKKDSPNTCFRIELPQEIQSSNKVSA